MDDNSTRNNVFDSASDLDREFLQGYIRSVCNSEGFDANQITHFTIELPFFIPISSQHVLSMTGPEDSMCVYLFKITLKKVTVASDVKHSHQQDVKKSVIEMLHITKNAVDANDKDFDPTANFDILTEKLNVFLLAYLFNFKNTGVYRISRLMLNPICICSVFRFEGLLLENQVLFILHPEVPVEINIMTTADIQRVVDFTYVIRGVLNPFLKQEEVFLSAQRYLKEGFFIEAVTYAQMMMDEFLRTLYVQLLIAEGKTEAEADSTRENTPFLAIVKQGLHGRIGGQWQINRTGTVVSDWYNYTYVLRNRVAHGAYFPSYTESNDAIDKAGKLRNHVIGLISRKKEKYPQIHQYFSP